MVKTKLLLYNNNNNNFKNIASITIIFKFTVCVYIFMGRAEDVLKLILADLMNSRFKVEIPKKELIMIINKYTQSPYGYFNRLCADDYIKINNNDVIEIVNTVYKGDNNDTNNDDNSAGRFG